MRCASFRVVSSPRPPYSSESRALPAPSLLSLHMRARARARAHTHTHTTHARTHARTKTHTHSLPVPHPEPAHRRLTARRADDSETTRRRLGDDSEAKRAPSLSQCKFTRSQAQTAVAASAPPCPPTTHTHTHTHTLTHTHSGRAEDTDLQYRRSSVELQYTALLPPDRAHRLLPQRCEPERSTG